MSDVIEIEEMSKKYISVSQVETYRTCPMRYYFRYIKGLKTPPSGAIVLGSSTHKAIEVNNTQKITSKQDEKLSVLTDAFVQKFQEGQKDVAWAEDEKPQDLEKCGLGLVKLFHEEVAPQIMPREAEARKTVRLSELDRDLVAVIDVIDIEGAIHDYKTASKAPVKDVLTKSLQLPVYARIYREEHGKEESRIIYDYLVKTKVPKYIPIETEEAVSDEKIESAMETIKTVCRCIDAGLFYPRTDHFGCNEKWCGYWNICKK